MRISRIASINLAPILFLFSPISAQVSGPVPQQQPGEAQLERRMADIHLLKQKLEVITRKPREMPVEPKLTGAERERVLRLRRVAFEDVKRNEKLLARAGTGIFKLFPDIGCISKNVVRVAVECEQFVPISSAFTFRTNGYSDELYHDIFFKKDHITSNAFFSQGIFGIVGDVEIDSIDKDHPSLEYLRKYEPAIDPKTAQDHACEFQKGIEANGYRYSDLVIPRENVTYVMRMIAYRLDNTLKPVDHNTAMNEIMFHSLSFDKRIDMTVVFRLLGRDELGGYTVVWKELDRRDAAKIKFGKGQPLRDFRPQNKS
jgi:hypothetical protein